MKTCELDYDLPRELIAQYPCHPRDEARLLVLDRSSKSFYADVFHNIAQYLGKGDCMVLNNTQVIPARVHAHKMTGGRVEVFVLREESSGIWQALVRPSARLRPGTKVTFADGTVATLGETLADGRRRIYFGNCDVYRLLDKAGSI